MITKDQLLPPIAVAYDATDTKATLPILANILLEIDGGTIRATGTDLQSQIIARATADDKSSISAAVPSRKFVDIVKMLPDGAEIKLAFDGTKLAVKSGRSRYNLACLPADHFPGFESRGTERATVELPPDVLLSALNRVRFAAGSTDVRTYLNGVALQLYPRGIRSIASDGFRLSLFSQEVDGYVESGQIIIPNDSVAELCKLLAGFKDESVQVVINEATISVAIGDVQYASKLIEGRYPDVDRVIAKHFPSSFSVNVRELSDAIRRAAVILGDKSTGMTFTIRSDAIFLSASNTEAEDSSEEVAIIGHHGDERTVGYSYRYLLDSLSACKADTASVGIAENGAMRIADAGDSGWMTQVMPMRI